MRAALFTVLIAVTAILTFASRADASASMNPDPQAIAALIDQAVGSDAPGVAVGVVRDGEIVITHASGLADLSNPAPLTVRSRFNIASNAKQFTALMILELAEAGQVELSEDFRTYLPDAMPNVRERITVEQLLGHTSGVRDIYDLWALTGVTWYERPYSNRDAMALLNRQTALNFAPGSQYGYSNSNYILLAELIAAVTDQRFHAHARAFFDARGMQATGVRRRYGVVLPDLARAYGNWDGWLEDPALANLQGDGFLFSTLEDQLHWERQVQGAEPSLSRDLIDRSQGPIPGSAHANYGYGLEFGVYRGLPITFHVGSTGGYNAYTLRFPAQNTSIVVMGNTTEVGVVQLGRQVADLILETAFGENPPFPDRPETVNPDHDRGSALGFYEFDSGTLVSIVERDGELYREIEGSDPVRLIAEGGNIYRYESNPGLRVAFETTADGRRRFDLFAAFQAPQGARQIDDAPEGDSYRRSLEGRFVNAETDTIIELRHVAGDEFEMIKNGRSRTAALIAQDYLAWNNYRIRVEQSGGRAQALSVDNNRIRSVAFSRMD
ncbi:MAG: serine hydrolase domain-containing protein [Oceanicaulis sp.]